MKVRLLRYGLAAVDWTTRLIFSAWMVGRFLSDRTSWSQWLLWIPTPVILLTACAGLLATAGHTGPRRRDRVIAWSAVLGLTAIYFTTVEHRFLRAGGDPDGGVTIAHWTVNASRVKERTAFAETLVELDPDVALLTSNGWLTADPAMAPWLEDGRRVMLKRPFTVISSVPLERVRWLLANADAYVLEIVLDTSEKLGRMLTVWMIDLPSDPRRARAASVETVRARLAERTETMPDLIIGDLNTTRGSYALRRLAPDYVHAWNKAGRGYGATWPRFLPVYHIDHALTRPDLVVNEYELINPGVGQHVLQWLEVAKAEN